MTCPTCGHPYNQHVPATDGTLRCTHAPERPPWAHDEMPDPALFLSSEQFVAGYISTLAPFEGFHPAWACPVARAAIEALDEWTPELRFAERVATIRATFKVPAELVDWIGAHSTMDAFDVLAWIERHLLTLTAAGCAVVAHDAALTATRNPDTIGLLTSAKGAVVYDGPPITFTVSA